MKQLIYTGIGSRKTPPEMQETMFRVAQQLAQSGWLLRSGHADGADQAFEVGCTSVDGMMVSYLPWAGFNEAPRNDPRFVTRPPSDEAEAAAAQMHPAWDRCNPSARLMHIRNVYQVAGDDLASPTDLVICWTEGARGGGGTGQAIRVANHLNIPVFDLADPNNWGRLCEFVSLLEAKNKAET